MSPRRSSSPRFQNFRPFKGRGFGSWQTEGFSLVEVVLAIGIISFGLISMMGLLPSGLQAFRSSMERTVSAQVAQAIMGEAKQKDFTNLTSAAATYRYFTQEGVETLSRPEGIYTAEVTLTNQVGVPGSGSAQFTNRSLALVRVRIAHNPAGAKSDPLLFSGSNIPAFTTYVARKQ